MVQSYNTLLAEGSISLGSRPQSSHSRSRIDTAGKSPGGDVKVFANSLYDAGDILAGAPDPPAAAPRLQTAPQPPPMSPLAAGGSQKFQQQRVLAAQKRMERLQMGGLAQSNDSVAVVSVSNSRPGTPKTAKLAEASSSSPSALPAAPVPAPPTTLPGPGSRSHRMRTGGTTAAAGVSTSAGHAEPWQGSGPVSSSGTPAPPNQHTAMYDEDEGLEVVTLDEPKIRPGTASSQQSSGGQHSIPGLKQPQAAAVDVSNLSLFLRRPAPHASQGTVLCCIERTKAGMGKSPIYRFHLEMPNGGYQFLLSARKRVKTRTSSYVISSSPDDLARHSSSCVAKLRSNFVGTGFSIYLTGSEGGSSSGSRPGSGAAGSSSRRDPQRQLVSSSTAGYSPLQAGQGSLRHQTSRGSSSSGGSSGRTTGENVAWQAAGSPGGKQEVGAVLYEYNVLGTRGPRKLSVAVPHIDEAGNVLWTPSGPQDSMAERLKAGGSATNHLVVLRNKEPKWNASLNAYCLNFNGRVTEASVKNFQLVTADNPDAVVLQFGKTSDTCFTCDFSWPLSPLQAFSICLSSFDHKLACE